MQVVESAVGTWSFSAHDFDADELLYAALVMLQHALQMPELEKWRMSTGEHFIAERTALLLSELTCDLQTTLRPS